MFFLKRRDWQRAMEWMKQSINSFSRIEIPSDQSMIPISLEDVTIH